MKKVILLLLTFNSLFARHPVLLIPGLSGSQILYKPDSASDWTILWLYVLNTINPDWFPLIEAKYDPASDIFYSSVESQPRHWGSVEGIDHLDNLFPSRSYVFHELIDALEDAEYTDENDLFGAPYDFRLESYVNAPKPGGLFEKLKELIEKMVSLNKELAVIVTHSEGSAIFRHFLANYVDQSWKDHFIKSWISAAGAFAGAPSAFHYLISYKQWEIPTINAKNTHDILQFFSGLYWMLPSLTAFPPDYLLAEVTAGTEKFIITVENMTEGFKRSVGGNQVFAANNTLNAINSEFTNPNVVTYLHYGSGVRTTTSERYVSDSLNDWWQQDGEEIYGDGDGTVPFESLTAPFAWMTSSTAPIYTIERPGVSHGEIINDEAFIRDVITIATKNTTSEAARGIYTLRRRHVHSLHKHAADLQKDVMKRLSDLIERVVKEKEKEEKEKRRVKGREEEESIVRNVVRRMLDEAGEFTLRPALVTVNKIYNKTRLALRAIVQPHLSTLASVPLERKDGEIDGNKRGTIKTTMTTATVTATSSENLQQQQEQQQRHVVYGEYEREASSIVKEAMEKMDALRVQLLGEGEKEGKSSSGGGALGLLERRLKDALLFNQGQ